MRLVSLASWNDADDEESDSVVDSPAVCGEFGLGGVCCLECPILFSLSAILFFYLCSMDGSGLHEYCYP